MRLQEAPPRRSLAATALLALALALPRAAALDNGFRVPAMGWSSWYGFTNNINRLDIFRRHIFLNDSFRRFRPD